MIDIVHSMGDATHASNAEQRRRLDELGASDVQLKDLAGNSFVAPCYMAVLLGLITNFPLQVLQDRVTQEGEEYGRQEDKH